MPVERRSRRVWWRIEAVDWRWLAALTLVAALLRFGSPFFLDFITHPGSGPPISAWGIGHQYQTGAQVRSTICQPSDTIAPCTPYVFDELYFANDAHDDLLGRDYLDPEPPLAKLIIALGIKIFGFNPFGWRVMSAIFGTLLVPLMYLLARQLLPMRIFAVAAGFLTTFDGMTFVQSRIGMIDIFPIVFIVAAYLAFHLHLRADTTARQRLTLVAAALLLGLALGAKWISLAAYGTIAVLLVSSLLLRRIRYDALTGVVALLSLALLPGVVYLLTFTRYLTIAHSLTGFSPPALGFSPFHFDPGQAWRQLAEFHRWTFNYHYTLRAPHPYYSPWYSWPVLYRPVAYYFQGQGLGVDQVTRGALAAEIYNLGNPVIWWASIAGLVVVAATFVRRRTFALGFILLAFAAAWLPFSRVPRGLFLYHMFGGLPLMILGLAFLLSQVWPITVSRWGMLGQRLGRVLVLAYLITVFAFFCYFYPLWTGLPLSYDAWLEHMWFPSWI
jgi:dolichyl-phosphate-mannose-protein mannosyltransferase